MSAKVFENLSSIVLMENGWYFKEKNPRTASAEWAPEDNVLGHLYEL